MCHSLKTIKNKRKIWQVVTEILLLLLLGFALPSSGEGAAVIVPGRELQQIMGDLSALSLAARLYYEDTHKTQCPALDDLGRYFKPPLPSSWKDDYRIEAADNTWWVGRAVPEFSRTRQFLRGNAPSLGIYDTRTMGAWLGGSFVWYPAVRFYTKDKKGILVPDGSQIIRVAQGEGQDNQHLFFNSPGTEFYWWSNLLYTTDAHASALSDFGAQNPEGPFVIPPAPAERGEKISASPVSPPPDYTLEKEEDTGPGISVGDVMITPGGRN